MLFGLPLEGDLFFLKNLNGVKQVLYLVGMHFVHGYMKGEVPVILASASDSTVWYCSSSLSFLASWCCRVVILKVSSLTV